MAPGTPHSPTQAASRDDGEEGRSAGETRRPLLPVPELAGADRELDRWEDHADLSDLRSQTGHQSQTPGNRQRGVEWV